MKIIVSLLLALSIVTGIATSANAFDVNSDDAQFECQANGAPQSPRLRPLQLAIDARALFPA
jgi:hypothetical protein